MLFQILSDIHIEKLNEKAKVEDYIIPAAEILILAGDIGHIEKYNQLINFLKKLSKKFKYVIYILGNHEYYNKNNIPMEVLEEKIKKHNIENLYILNSEILIIDKFCICGCTLWSNPKVKIPSFVEIYDINKKFKQLYYNNLEFIKKTINYCKIKKLKLIVVTHYSPLKEDIKNIHRTLYASNLNDLIKNSNMIAWIYGHTGKNRDFILNGTRIVTNQNSKNLKNFEKSKILSL